MEYEELLEMIFWVKELNCKMGRINTHAQNFSIAFLALISAACFQLPLLSFDRRDD